jgi:tryptophan-rich sensory protein
MTQKQKSEGMGLGIALAAPFVVAAVGGLITRSSVSTWYPTLRKPAWNPPAWVFGPVWTLLYLLMGIASWLIWQKRAEAETSVRQALGWYGLQLGLNLGWSAIFFGLRQIGLALFEIVTLWSALAVTFVKFGRIRLDAAGLLLPYLLWTTFAASLNAAIWWLNRDH